MYSTTEYILLIFIICGILASTIMIGYNYKNHLNDNANSNNANNNYNNSVNNSNSNNNKKYIKNKNNNNNNSKFTRYNNLPTY